MNNNTLTVLGIETSCDETAAAIVQRTSDGQGTILSNIINSQIEKHKKYGGVVPEIAARSHISVIENVIKSSLNDAKLSFNDINAIAVTAGPGLKGGLLVGLTTAKALSMARGIPLIGVNHLEAHALTIRLIKKIEFPYLLLLVSGGHTQILIVNDVGKYERLGTTIDDAVGEAYDKVAKLLNLGYPGGPIVEEQAKRGDSKKIKFPRPLIYSGDLNFSFSGLKTAVRREIEKSIPLTKHDAENICSSFQDAVISVIINKLEGSIKLFKIKNPKITKPDVVIAGGVASNKTIYNSINNLSTKFGVTLHVPPQGLCTDNGAMVAWAGAERFSKNHIDNLSIEVKPRWPLDPEAKAAIGAGVKA